MGVKMGVKAVSLHRYCCHIQRTFCRRLAYTPFWLPSSVVVDDWVWNFGISHPSLYPTRRDVIIHVAFRWRVVVSGLLILGHWSNTHADNVFQIRSLLLTSVFNNKSPLLSPFNRSLPWKPIISDRGVSSYPVVEVIGGIPASNAIRDSRRLSRCIRILYC